ncbi:MAG: DEAD/DEAH box helicase, partial [Acidaminococcaceae bacterium]|nr:DEAD/DEAH box helicase [Acidaminococcaceae bacterium]
MQPEQLLKTRFGYDGFRPGQREIVTAILSDRDCLALLPTGGGKSVCFQVPALMQNGVTFVISP